MSLPCKKCIKQIDYLSVSFPNDIKPNYCVDCMHEYIHQYNLIQIKELELILQQIDDWKKATDSLCKK